MGLFSRKKKPELKKLPDFPTYESQLKSIGERPFPKIEMPASMHPIEEHEFDMPIRKPAFEPIGQEKPLFIKIEKYKAGIKNITEIKTKLAEAETILRNLNKIKAEEAEEIKLWEQDIENIKNKLLEVDKILFEA